MDLGSRLLEPARKLVRLPTSLGQKIKKEKSCKPQAPSSLTRDIGFDRMNLSTTSLAEKGRYPRQAFSVIVVGSDVNL